MMETKFYPPTIKDGKILAFADVDIVEGITVRGFRIVNGDNGLRWTPFSGPKWGVAKVEPAELNTSWS